MKSVGTGKARNEIYVSRWFAWESMQFLDDPEELRPTISNQPRSDQCTSENEEVNEEMETVNINPEENTDSLTDNDNEEDPLKESNDSGVAASTKKHFLSPKSRAPKKKRTEDPRVAEALSILRKSFEIEKKDTSALFGEFIVDKLRSFDARTRAIVQYQIQTCILQAEIGAFQLSNSPTNSTEHTFQHLSPNSHQPSTSFRSSSSSHSSPSSHCTLSLTPPQISHEYNYTSEQPTIPCELPNQFFYSPPRHISSHPYPSHSSLISTSSQSVSPGQSSLNISPGQSPLNNNTSVESKSIPPFSPTLF